ncbi:Methyltransferase-like protein 27 [Fulvia fulva]|uniref:Methyltransferase-like protein 27 n=1 Tax=Passalora fulva TaxID=5499 RepID=A0A9Q8PKY6_PASFU|nr:Methyltransferase-like protein 27 [Fulvia fulva]KAK4610640.1 Methyltransferase-like protein 27 [Fulvia fulva]KAK4610936.1 Methyltransferase-like protein 27 [Fulvia fulva]UJO24554.1 Methyltransferase-like protein 27 [Fulvia fulva]WPV22301.1 Methyltransferase-like protein 27 [Fulvia fulva]WPV36736.1 Methyltransferase-like protein 27 [Fulvia fulva]
MSDRKDLTHTTSGQSAEYLTRAYNLKDANGAKDLYEEWASSYDTDLQSSSYTSPQLAVTAVLKNITPSPSHLKILDAGCGTGLVGLHFSHSPLTFTIDGLDLTPAMLKVARQKGIYQDLDVADLTKPIERVDGSYDVCTCVGTLTKGHVGPQVFNEFVRVVAHGGIIVATVHDDVWESGGYRSVVEGLERRDLVEVVGTEEFGMVEGSGKGGRMVVLRKR